MKLINTLNTFFNSFRKKKILFLFLFFSFLVNIAYSNEANELKKEEIDKKQENFFSSLFSAYLTSTGNSVNDYIDKVIKVANSIKLSNFLIKSKIKKELQTNKELNIYKSNIHFVDDYIKEMKVISASDFNLKKLYVEDAPQKPSKEESSFISLLSKIVFEVKSFSPINIDYDYENEELKRLDSKYEGKKTEKESKCINNHWKAYLVLMGMEGVDNRIIKICYSSLPSNKGMFIRVPYEETCTNVINILYKSKILSLNYENNKNCEIKSINKQLEKIDLGDVKKDNKDNKNSNLNLNKNKSISFIEKSVSTEEKITETKKAFSASQLADKFSVNELNKIKSIIKFAKKNKISDKIYEKKGDVSLEELLPNMKKDDEQAEKNQKRFDGIENLLKSIQNELKELKTQINVKNNSINSASSNEGNEIENQISKFEDKKRNKNNNRLSSSSNDIERLFSNNKSVEDDDSFLDSNSNYSSRYNKSNSISSFDDDLEDEPKDKKREDNYNRSNINKVDNNRFSASKTNLRAKPINKSHSYNYPAPSALHSPAPASSSRVSARTSKFKVSPSHSPAPAASKSNFRQATPKAEIIDEDDLDAFDNP